MAKAHGATVSALAIGAVSAVFIGVPMAALIWLFRGVAFDAHPELDLSGAYLVLVWGLFLMGPSSLVLGAIGGVIALKLAHWLQGSEFIVGVAVCGAFLGALNGALARFLEIGETDLLLVGATAGALTGPIAGLIIRKVCGTESVASNAYNTRG